MRHGIHIPKDDRQRMAAESAEIFRHAPSKAAALKEICSRFSVSMPTARNLLGYGLNTESAKP